MSIVRLPAAAGAALVIAALLTGCGSSTKAAAPAPSTSAAPTTAQSTAAASDSGSATPSAAASDSATGGAAGGGAVATGVDLKALLPTAATLPSGWTLSGDGNEFDTGTRVMDPGTPQLPQEGCTGLTNAGGGSFSVDLRASYASSDLLDAKSSRVKVLVAAYHPGDAAKLLAEIRDFAGRCATYTTNAVSGGTVSMSASATPVAGFGDEGVDFKNVPKGQYVTSETVIARIGDKLLFVDGSDAGGSLPDLMQLAGPLAKTIK